MPNGGKWDGTIERRNDPNDHDRLTRTLVILENLVNNFNAHVLDDKENFKGIEKKMWEHARYIYIGIGIVGVVEVLVGIHK